MLRWLIRLLLGEGGFGRISVGAAMVIALGGGLGAYYVVTQGGAPACTQTISPGTSIATTVTNASAGATICLNAGSYGDISLSSVSKASDVTVQPVSSATVTIGALSFNNVNHLRFTGQGGTKLSIGGVDIDTSSGTSDHLTFDHATFTDATLVFTRGSNQAILFDNDVFDNLPTGTYEGRLSVRGFDNSSANGVTISNNHFGDGGCSDGVQVIGSANGTVIGPGNEFTGIVQSGCTVHADPIQFYGAVNTVVTGNYFHDNGDGTGGLESFDGNGEPSTVTNNVFVCTCVYPWSIYGGGAQNWVIRHNTIAGGGNVGLLQNNQSANPSGNLVRDNVWAGGGGLQVQSGYGTNDHNLNSGQSGTGNLTGTPTFVGGANPTTYEGFRLAGGSIGKNAASDSTDMGIP